MTPASVPVRVWSHGVLKWSVSYAVRKSAYAATAFVLTAPLIVHPVFTKVPGNTTPTSPVTVEVVHVTAPAAGPPARAANPDAAPSEGPKPAADPWEGL